MSTTISTESAKALALRAYSRFSEADDGSLAAVKASFALHDAAAADNARSFKLARIYTQELVASSKTKTTLRRHALEAYRLIVQAETIMNLIEEGAR